MANPKNQTMLITDGEKYNTKTPTTLARERKMTGTAINENTGEGRTLSQVSCINLRFMFQTRKNNKVVFHLAQSLKDFVAAGKAFDHDFSILPLYGDSAAI
jgi:hypothetical protein